MRTATPSSSLIQQRINPISGESEWVLLHSHDEEAEEDGNGRDHATNSLVQTSYLDMLNDKERNQAFERAIRQAIASSPSPPRVLDIGAGTGLLSMMAAKALQETFPLCTFTDDKPVTACEAFLPMFRLTRKVISSNGFSSLVHLVHRRSDEMEMSSDITTRADILVTEILDSTLLGEGLIPTIQHAHDNLLKPNACVIPCKATIYAQLVQSDYLWKQHDLYGVERQLADGLILHPPKFKEHRSLKRQQYPMHIDPLFDKMEMISNPFKVFEFDLSTRPDGFGKVEVPIKTIKKGVVHAIISWWVLELDDNGSILYSTAPKWIQTDCNGRSWHDHWKQCVWFVSGRGLDVTKETGLIVSASHDPISFVYDNISYTKASKNPSSLETINHDFWNWIMKPARVGQLGSSKWRRAVMSAMKSVVHNSLSHTCLVIDDSLPLVISAALVSNSTAIFALLPSMQSSGSKILEDLLEANSLSSDRVKLVRKRVKELSLEDINMKVDILIGEPYYQLLEDMVPWRNLRFWKERTLLDPFLSEKFVTIPCKGILRGMAMSMRDLWESRQALKTVRGFDHVSVNAIFGACGDLPKPLEGPILPYFLWQCGAHQELTQDFSIMTFDFSKTIEDVKGHTKIAISRSGTCHGIVLWIDWILDSEGREMIYTGPQADGPSQWRQGVKLLPCPVEVEELQSNSNSCNYSSILDLSATFNSSSVLLRRPYKSLITMSLFTFILKVNRA